jgi:predicted nucleotide-binding protein
VSDRSAQFIAVSEKAAELADRESELDGEPLDRLAQAARTVGRAWSRSNLGYQANVYYSDFGEPPPGAVFSREWGFAGAFTGTRGDWRITQPDDVVSYIEQLADAPDTGLAKAQSDALRPAVEELIQRARSLAAKIPPPHDDYLRANIEDLQRVALPDPAHLARVQMNTTSGQFVIRDMQAAEGGWQPAAHQVVIAGVMHIKSPYAAARQLAAICRNLGMHLEGESLESEMAVVQLGSKVFIGHGGTSGEYLKLGVWLTDLGLEWEVFDRRPTAGMSIKERLQEMLDNAQIAFLIMTPEDEDAGGKMRARANVIHEVGLFQGRLGWLKAIVLLEEGCEDFSNIDGVGQIHYPRANIKAVFDDIRQVLQREGVLPRA